MLSATLHNLRLPLLAAAVAALVLAAGSQASGPSYLVIDGPNSGSGSTRLTGGYEGHLFSATDSNAGAQAVGVTGVHSAGSGTGPGVLGVTAATTAGSSGVYGYEKSASAGVGSAGVVGRTDSTVGGTDPGGGVAGVLGLISSVSPGYWSAGVRGINNSTTGSGLGVWGSVNGGGWGVYGRSKNGHGVTGMSVSPCTPDDPANNSGVLGLGQGYSNYGSLGGCRDGVVGKSTLEGGLGVAGVASAHDGAGVYGRNDGAAQWAGYFVGPVEITGHLKVLGGCEGCAGPAPLAADQVAHAANGNAVTDGRGYAVVHLPGSFHATGDLRYQLTPIGQFAQAIVWKKVAAHAFTIRTDKPHVEVSWQVTRPS